MQQRRVTKQVQRRARREYTDTFSQAKSQRRTDRVEELLGRIDRCLSQPVEARS